MVEAALVSHPGRVRPENEDYAYHGETPHGYVGIVCDGMGGEAAGEVAARLAAEAAFQYLLETAPGPEPVDLLQGAIQAAQQRLMEAAQQQAGYQKFGTTIVLVLLQHHTAYYAHVGDSRLYLYSRQSLSLLTEDDSLVHQLLKEGLITPEQALHHPQKNILSQCLGPQQQPEPHTGQRKLRPGDLLLLCTDGLSNLLSQEEMTSILAQTTSLTTAAESLVSQANRQGGYDNITVLLLRSNRKTPTFVSSMILPPARYLIAGAVALVAAILILVIYTRRPASAETQDEEVVILTDSSQMDTTPLPAPPPETEAVSSVPGESEASPPAVPSPEVPQPPTETRTPAHKTAASTKKPSSSPAGTTIEIMVQKGDNLTQIAKAFRTTRSAIQKANNLQSENIRAGQKLTIPVKSVKMHTVHKGENLSKLARENHSSIEAIRRSNNLSDRYEIKVGQKLKIPVLE